MKVLIVDDEEGIRSVIKEYCISENFSVAEASNGIEALEALKSNDIDIIVLDIMMPKMDGYTTLKEMKKKYKIPVIILSARSEEFDKLLGFELGIDDYLTKPFSPKELIARIKAILNRNKVISDKYVYKKLVVDYLAHKLTIDNKTVNLTPKQFELLCLFIQNKDIALTRETIISKIWGFDFYGDDRTLDTHIKMLRSNLGKYRDLIVTLRDIGYRFEEK